MRLPLASRLFLALFLSVVLNVTFLLVHTGAALTREAAPPPANERIVRSEGFRAGATPGPVRPGASKRSYRISTPGVR